MHDDSTTTRALLVASTGGHLSELVRLRERFEPPFSEASYVTFDDPQSRSLLAGENVEFVPRIGQRDLRAALAALPRALRSVRRAEAVVTTGAAVAVPYLLAARLRGVPGHYVESAARTTSPSLTGRLAAAIPGTRLYCQYRNWDDRRFVYGGSVFDGFRSEPSDVPARPPRRVVVSLGTLRGYPYVRAVRAARRLLSEVGSPSTDVVWQVGDAAAQLRDQPETLRDLVPASELQEAIAAADLVIAHCGVGTALAALEAGLTPLLLPRLAVHHEHVDDHQTLIGHALETRGLAVCRDADLVTAEDVQQAMGRRVVTDSAAPFRLSAVPPRRRRHTRGSDR